MTYLMKTVSYLREKSKTQKNQRRKPKNFPFDYVEIDENASYHLP